MRFSARNKTGGFDLIQSMLTQLDLKYLIAKKHAKIVKINAEIYENFID